MASLKATILYLDRCMDRPEGAQITIFEKKYRKDFSFYVFKKKAFTKNIFFQKMGKSAKLALCQNNGFYGILLKVALSRKNSVKN